LWDVTLPFWVIMRSGRRNVMNHIASRGLVVLSSGCGEFAYHESYCDESGIMTIYGFQFFCDVSSEGWRRVLIWFLECIKNHTSYYFQYKVDNSQCSSFIGIFSDHMNKLWFAKMSSLSILVSL
jgi:hypothetical protein